MLCRSLATFLLTLPSFLAPLSAQANDKNQIELRVLSLREHCGPPSSDRPPTPTPLLPSLIGRESILSFEGPEDSGDWDSLAWMRGDGDSRGPLERSELVELLQFLTDSRTWEARGASISSEGSTLKLVHERATLDRCAAVLGELRAALAARWSFDVVIFDRSKAKDLGVPQGHGLLRVERKAGVELYRRLANASREIVVGRGHCELRPRGVASIGTKRRKRVTMRLDGEVAERAQILAPTAQALSTGTQLSITPIPCVGERIAVSLFFSDRRVQVDDNAYVLETTQHAQLDRVALDESLLAASCMLGHGEQIVLAPGRRNGRDLCALVMARRRGAAPTGQLGFDVLKTGLFSSRSMRYVSRETIDGDDPIFSIDTQDRGDLAELVRNAEIPGLADEQLRETNDALVIRASKRTRDATRAFVESLEAPRRRSFVLHLRREVREKGSWREDSDGLALPLLNGRIGMMSIGESTNFVKGYNVEIAKRAKIAVPVTSSVFGGAQLVARVQASGEAASVDLDLLDSRLRPAREVAARGVDLGKTWSLPTERVRIRRSLRLLVGKPELLGHGPAIHRGQEVLPTRLMITLREIL